MSSNFEIRTVPDHASTSCAAPIKLSEIVHILKPLEDKYHELGVQLDVGIDRLKQIEGEHKVNLWRFSETIGSWQRNTSANCCSWSALADAVDRVGGYDNLVRELRAHDNGTDENCSPNQQLHCHGDTENSEDPGYFTKSDLASADSSGSEIEHFDKIPGCGCDNPCPIYTLCAKGCPKPTSTKVGVVRKRVEGQTTQNVLLSEEEAEEEDYTEKFEKETRKMQKQFARLVNDTCRSFKNRNVTTNELILYLQNAYPLALKPRMDEMSKAACLEKVFMIVTSQTCSWFDYEVIKDMIDYLGKDQEKKQLEHYEAKFRTFAEQRLSRGKKHIEVSSGAKSGGKQLVIKIDKEWDEVNFNDLNKIRGNLASILKVKRRDLYLADIQEGCIMMTFIIAEELAGKLFPISSMLCSYLTPFQIKSLQDEGIILFTCGTSVSWLSATEQKESELQCNEVSHIQRGFDSVCVLHAISN